MNLNHGLVATSGKLNRGVRRIARLELLKNGRVRTPGIQRGRGLLLLFFLATPIVAKVVHFEDLGVDVVGVRTANGGVKHRWTDINGRVATPPVEELRHRLRPLSDAVGGASKIGGVVTQVVDRLPYKAGVAPHLVGGAVFGMATPIFPLSGSASEREKIPVFRVPLGPMPVLVFIPNPFSFIASSNFRKFHAAKGIENVGLKLRRGRAFLT